MSFNTEGNKGFMHGSILCPVVVVHRKDLTYYRPSLSLGVLEEKLKLK